MKKWHLEEVLQSASCSKIALPNPGQTASFLCSSSVHIRKDRKIVVFFRYIAAFLIRVF